MHTVHEIGHALYMAFAMFWEILWALILDLSFRESCRQLYRNDKWPKFLVTIDQKQ